MKQLVEVILIFLFFLQGANNMSGITVVFLLLLLTVPFIGKNNKIRIPDYFSLAVIIYCFYMILGLINKHPSPHIDIKFQLFGFIFFLGLINQRVKVDYLNILFKINIGVLLVYLLLLTGIVPNIWHESTFGRQGRILGPAIISITIILFYYLVKGKPFDKKLGLALLCALVYLLLTSNFTSIAVVSVLTGLIIVDWKKLFSPVYLLAIAFFLILGAFYLQSDYVPKNVAAKLEYVYKPWEYGTVQTRIQDLQQALYKEDFGVFEKIFGEGFGTKSTIYRENILSPSFSRNFAFREIDNGFYYVYHRGGWSLLILFIATHIFLASKLRNTKAKIGFFIILLFINLLTIHYFSNLFYLLIAFFALYQDRISYEPNATNPLQ